MTKHFLVMLLVGILFLMLSSALPLSAQDTEGLQPGLAIPQVSIALFSEAKASSTRLITIEAGELVNILKIEGPWAQIEYKDVTGWARYAMGLTEFLINVNGPTPSARVGSQMIYDTKADRMILFGGISMGSVWLNDTWTYEVGTNSWAKMNPAQSPTSKGLGPLAYDIQSDRAIWFYGVNDTYDNPSSETWVYDLNSDNWTKMDPIVAPPSLVDPNMVYDAESDRIILFGGVDPATVSQGTTIVFHNETWAYDYDTNTWTNMQPKLSPPGMNLYTMTYDSAADRIVVLGYTVGFTSPEKTEHTWLYDYNTNTWEDLGTAGPGSRAFSSLVYAAGNNRSILFGNGDPQLMNDTWSFDLDTGTWMELTPQSPPEGRKNHTMAYSSVADRIVLFGGNDGQNDCMDTWLYDPNANVWTQVGP